MRIILFFCLLFLLVPSGFAQKRGKTTAKTSKANSLKALSPEQKDFVLTIIDCADEVETAFVTSSPEIADTAFLFCGVTIDKIENASLPEPINKYARTTQAIYLDLGILYGKTTNTGLYNSTRSLQRSLGDQSGNEVTPIISRYKLQGLNSSQAIKKVHSFAIMAKNLLQNTLAKSPTDKSAPRSTFESNSSKTTITPEQPNTSSGGRGSLIGGILAGIQGRETQQSKPDLLKTSIGKWRLTSEAEGNKLVFDLTIFQENGVYYCGLSEPDKPTELRVKMQTSGNNFVIDFPVAIPIEGQDFYFRFSSSKIEPQKMFGSTIASNKKGVEVSIPFEAVRIQ